jgi:hypothetical protein
VTDMDEDGYDALARDMVEILIGAAIAVGVISLVIWWLV